MLETRPELKLYTYSCGVYQTESLPHGCEGLSTVCGLAKVGYQHLYSLVMIEGCHVKSDLKLMYVCMYVLIKKQVIVIILFFEGEW